MNYFCTKCKINWARLYSESVEDETYECCPRCKSDMDLIEGADAPAYIMNPFNSHIINIATGNELEEPEKVLPTQIDIEPVKDFVETEAARARREDRAIDAYHKHGEAAYWGVHRGSKEDFMQQREDELYNADPRPTYEIEAISSIKLMKIAK